MPFELSVTRQSGKGSVLGTAWPFSRATTSNSDLQACREILKIASPLYRSGCSGVLITSIYLPNGNPQPGPKFNYKLAWFERLIARAAELMASGAPVVLAGDYNVVPTSLDIYPTRSLDDNALVQPASRKAFARLLAQGWADAMRKLHPDKPLWTFWDYKFERWAHDKGMRLDHFLLSPNLSDRLVDGGVDRWARGQVNASDHAPARILLDL